MDPKNVDSIFCLGHAYELAGNLERAKQLYERGLTLAPGYLDISLGLARVLLRDGRADRAKEIAEAVVRQEPDNTDALFVLGLVAERQHDTTDALRRYDRVLAISPRNSDALAARQRLLGSGR